MDEKQIRAVGRFLVKSIVPLACESIVWGMYILVFIASTIILRSKPVNTSRQRRVRLAMFLLTVVLFAISSMLWMLDLFTLLRRTKAIFFNDTQPTLSFAAKIQEANDSTQRAASAAELLFATSFILGDSVVVWRTWHIWREVRWIRMVPVVLLFFSSVTVVTLFGCTIKEGFPYFFNYSPTCRKVELASWILSMTTNGIATSLIAYKAWIHRQTLKEVLGKGGQRTAAERVLSLLVESGLIYFVLWAVQTIGFYDWEYGPGLIVTQIINLIGYQVVGLYPTLIIVLVNLQRSFWDTPEMTERIELEFRVTGNTSTTRAGTFSGTGSVSRVRLKGSQEDSVGAVKV